MTSALRYVQSVKTRCADKPDMIKEFHTIMRSLNDKVMSPVDSYDRIKALFVDYADLIEGFQCFLPPSLRPAPIVKAPKVQPPAGQPDSSPTEPAHNAHRAAVNKRQLKATNPNAIELPPPLSQAQKLEHAVSFINNIKAKFPESHHFSTFNVFLNTFKQNKISQSELIMNVFELFEFHLDLITGFIRFLPSSAQPRAVELWNDYSVNLPVKKPKPVMIKPPAQSKRTGVVRRASRRPMHARMSPMAARQSNQSESSSESSGSDSDSEDDYMQGIQPQNCPVVQTSYYQLPERFQPPLCTGRTKNALASEVLNDFYRSRNVFDNLRDSRKTQHELNLFAIEDMQHLADLRVSLLQTLVEFLERVQTHILSLPADARRSFRLVRQQPVDSATTTTTSTTSVDQSKTSAAPVGNFELTPMHVRAVTMAFESRKNTDNVAGRFIYSDSSDSDESSDEVNSHSNANTNGHSNGHSNGSSITGSSSEPAATRVTRSVRRREDFQTKPSTILSHLQNSTSEHIALVLTQVARRLAFFRHQRARRQPHWRAHIGDCVARIRDSSLPAPRPGQLMSGIQDALVCKAVPTPLFPASSSAPTNKPSVNESASVPLSQPTVSTTTVAPSCQMSEMVTVLSVPSTSSTAVKLEIDQ